MRSYLILAMCGLYLFEYFFPYYPLQILVVMMSLVAFVGSLAKADRLPRYIGGLMMVIGIGLEVNKASSLDGIIQGLLSILPLMCLVTLAPLIAIPLRLGGYMVAVQALLRNLLNNPRKLYAGITGTLFLLCPILSLGTIRIIDEFLHELKLPSYMSAKSYLVGFSTSIFWSPYFASVSLVLYYLHIPFKEYILYGIGLSFLSLIIGNLLFAIWERKHPILSEPLTVVPIDQENRKKLVKLVLFVVTLMVVSLTIETLIHWSMIVIVCLLSLAVPLLWGGVSKEWRNLFGQLKDYRDKTVPILNNEIVLFLSAGLMGYSMKGTQLATGLSSFLTGLSKQSFLLFALTVIFMVLVVTYLGIHQIAAIGPLAMQLNAHDLGISNLSLAMLLLLAWSTSTALSPFSGLNLMVSRFTGISNIIIGLRSSGVHLSVMIILGLIIISCINLL